MFSEDEDLLLKFHNAEETSAPEELIGHPEDDPVLTQTPCGRATSIRLPKRPNWRSARFLQTARQHPNLSDVFLFAIGGTWSDVYAVGQFSTSPTTKSCGQRSKSAVFGKWSLRGKSVLQAVLCIALPAQLSVVLSFCGPV